MNLNKPGRVPKRKESVKKVSEEGDDSVAKRVLFRNGAKIEDFIRQ